MHAAAVIRALQKRGTHCQLYGLGGPQLERLGMELIVDCRDIAVVGIVEVLIHYRQLLAKLEELRARLRDDPPDLLVLVDYPDFNLKLAETAKQLGIKVLFYISPQVWAWRKKRVKRIGKLVDMMAVLFPFEETFYQEANIPVRFVGHPLVDEVKPSMSVQAAKTFFGVDPNAHCIGLLPGSRKGEVQRVLPTMLETAELIEKARQDIHFVLPIAETLDIQSIKDLISNRLKSHLHLVNGHSYDVMHASDALLCASGTATLEAALMGTPMAITYRINPLSYLILKRMITIPDIGLVNVVYGQRIVQEFIQREARPERIAEEMQRLLFDSDYKEKMKKQLNEVKEKMGQGGGAMNVAKLIEELLLP